MMQGKQCRVLVVEDQAVISIFIEDMLDDLGIEVVGPAARMQDALALARDGTMEAAILDIDLGGAATYPVADVLLARDIPTIFATGYGRATLPERFRGTPMLHKPFSREAFEAVMQTVLAQAPCEIKAA